MGAFCSCCKEKENLDSATDYPTRYDWSDTNVYRANCILDAKGIPCQIVKT